MNKRKKKKLLRNLICIAYCSVQLLVVVVAFKGLGVLIEKITGKDISEVFSSGIIFDADDEEEEEKYLFTVCLDAGHGGKDNGSDNGARFEKNDTLTITNEVAAYLREQQVKVVMTREDDTFLKLSERCDIANASQADYFVSLHRNSGEGNGVEIWIATDAGADTSEMADRIMDGLNAVGISRNRGVRKGTQQQNGNNYYINAHSNMPSCIVELGFMNSPNDNQLFDEKLKEYAKAVGDAVIAVWQKQNTGSSEGSVSPSGSEGGTGTPGTTGPNPGTPDGSGDGTMTGASENTGGDAALDGAVSSNTGRVEHFTPIENVASLSNSAMDWGQGSNMDEKNRPEGAVSAQAKYGSYEAYFIDDKMEDNILYLTFDEGYEYGCSPSILDTLKEKNVKAVFFVTEPYAKDQPDLVRRMIDEGHTLGNHSVTHPSKGLPSQSLETQENEVMENHRYIKDNFGYDMHLFRYPAGKFSEQSLALVHNCGYKSLFWSFAYLDYDVNNQPDQAASLQKMLDKLHPGAIYLLHAESETNTAVLGEFIDRARAAGYEFAVFD